jgi:hypothetical protein
MDEFSQYAVEEDEFSQYAAKPEEQEDEFSQFAAEEDEFSQYAVDKPKEESPTWISEPLTKQDIADVASKFGLTNREQIDSLITQAYLKGGTVEGETRPGQYAVGLASDLALPGDIPAYAQKKWQDDEGVRKAMDAIGDLVDKKKSTARAVGEFVGGFVVPGLGISKLSKAVAPLGKVLEGAAVGATSGAVQGLVESKEGQGAVGAAVGAVVGGALGGAIGGASRWITTAQTERNKKIIDAIMDETGEKDPAIMAKIKEAADARWDQGVEDAVLHKTLTDSGDVPIKAAGKDVAYDQLKQEKADFLQYVGHGIDEDKLVKAESLDDRIAAMIRIHGEEDVRDKYKKYLVAKTGDEFKDEMRIKNLDKVHQGLLRTVFVRPLESAMYMADRVDRMTGSTFNKQINNISRKLNNYKNSSDEQIGMITDLVKQTHAVSKTFKKQGVTKSYRDINNELYKILNGEIKVDDSFLKGNKDLVANWQSFWEQARLLNNQIEGEEVIKRFGEEVGQYVPHNIVSIDKAVEAIQKRLFYFEDTLPQFKKAMEEIQAGKAIGREDFLSSLTKEEDKLLFEDLTKSVMRVNGMTEAPKTINELVNVIETIKQNPANALRIGEMAARASKSRTGGTPQLIRETDLATLAEGWVMNTLKQAYVGKEAGEMKSQIMALQRAGFDKDMTQDMINLIQDIEIGSRAGTLSSKIDTAMKASSLRARKAAVIAEREGRPVAAMWNKTVAATPHVMQYLGNNIYPNTLGIFTNQRSPFKNMIQPFMQTSAEVGFRYALPTVFRAVASAAKHGLGNKIPEYLKSMGLHGENWEGILNAILTDQSSSKALRLFLAANHKAMSVAMKLFTQSEVINRYAATELGHKVGTDLVASLANTGKMDFNQTAALNFLDGMMSANKRDVMDQLKLINKATDTTAKAELTKKLQIDISQYLIQKTIFDYNKANASIVARYLPAPMLVFTKFPTYVASDIVHKIETQGPGAAVVPLLRAYMAPYALAEAADQLGENNMDDDENILHFALGKEGLSGITSVGSLGGFRSFGNPLLSAPVVSGWEALKGAALTATGDEEGAERAFEQAGKSAVSAATLYAPAIFSGPARGAKKLYNFVEGTDE